MNKVYLTIYLAIFLLINCAQVFAQAPNHLAELVAMQRRKAGDFRQNALPLFAPIETTSSRTALKAEISDGVILRLNASALQTAYVARQKGITLSLPLPNGGMVELELVETPISSDDFTVATTANGRVAYTGGAHYRGIIKGNEHSVAAISIFNNEVMGLFADETGNYVLGKLKDNSGDYVLYNDRDLLLQNKFKCADLDHFDAHDAHRNTQDKIATAPAMLCKKVTLYWECDYLMYQAHGSDVTATTNYAQALFNQMAALYQNEGIVMELVKVLVHTAPDGYRNDNSDHALTDFTAHWNGLGDNFGTYTTACGATANADLAHLLSRATTNNGGLAYISSSGGVPASVLCNRPIAYGYSNITGNTSIVPTYSWDVEVVTHEIGHNLGSKHTHNCTAWSGGMIDGCGPTAGYCDNGPCPDACTLGPIPTAAVGGTIMSYCHLLGSSSINLANGFGAQPQAKIRSEITGACLKPVVSVCITSTTPITGSGSNGAITTSVASASATSTTYTYQWFPRGGAGANNTGLSVGGTYTVVATDNNGCENTATTVVLPVPISTGGKIILVDASRTNTVALRIPTVTAPDWFNACKSLQTAIATAQSGDQIWVRAGTYKPTSGTDRNASFALKNGVQIYGGFAATETQKWQRNYTTNQTNLSGDIGIANDTTDNVYHVVNNQYIDATAVLDGFWVRNGNADGVFANDKNGAGMRNYYASPTIKHCTFDKNSAVFNGAGMYNQAATPVIDSCVFRYNVAGSVVNGYNQYGYGGGLFYTTITNSIAVSNTLFSHNTAPDGGGMYSNEAVATSVIGCTFDANKAGSGGGGSSAGNGGGLLLFNTSSMTLSTCKFSNNQAFRSGGGVYAYSNYGVSSNSVVTNCIFDANTASDGAGILLYSYYSNASMFLNSCKFTNNQATGYGGGAYLTNNYYGGTITINNNQFTANQSAVGGGLYLYNYYTQTSIQKSIFTNNTASDKGAGVYANNSIFTNCIVTNNTALNSSGGIGGYYYYYYPNTFINSTIANNTATAPTATSAATDTYYNSTFKNCIVANNTTPNNPSDAGHETFFYQPSLINTLVNEVSWVATAANGNLGGYNPQFVNANDPDGADNIWGTADDGLRLKPCSPAINAGANVNIPAGTTTDIANAVRIQQTTADMGAYESSYTNTGYTVGTITSTGSVCQNSPYVLTLTATAGIAPYTFVYKINNGATQTLVSNTASTNLTVNTSVGGYFVYDLISINGDSCVGASAGVTVKFTPTATISGIGKTCLYSTYNVTINTNVPPDNNGYYNFTCTYTINGGAPQTAYSNLYSPTSTIPINTYNTSGVQTIALTSITYNGCTALITGQVAAVTVLNSQPRIYVNKNVAAGGLNDGSSWANAFSELRDALAVLLCNTNEIWVAAGTYKPTATTNRNASFNLKSNIALYGGFGGTETTLAQRNMAAHNTILSGEIGSAAATDNAYHVVKVANAVANSKIDGFIIQGGYANDTIAPNNLGGGLYENSTYWWGNSIAVNNCIFTNNYAADMGGGAFFTNYSNYITNCIFTHNTAVNEGGGLLGYTSLYNCTFSNNQATGTTATNAAMNSSNAYNNILWGNTTPNNPNDNASREETNITNYWYSNNTNIIRGTVNGLAPNNVYSSDPLFVNAANPIGTDGVWGTADDGLRLQNCSLGINAGNSNYAYGTTDVTGAVRTQQTTVDMGAYESNYAATTGTITTISPPFYAQQNSIASVTFTGSVGVTSFTYTLNSGAPITVLAIGTTATITVPTNIAGAIDTVRLVGVTNTNGCTNTMAGPMTFVKIATPATITGSATVCPRTTPLYLTFKAFSNYYYQYGINQSRVSFTYNINGGPVRSVISSPYPYYYSYSDTAMVKFTPTTAGVYTFTILSMTDKYGISRPVTGQTATITVGNFSVLYVNKNVVGGLNNGTSWANAYTELRDALTPFICSQEVWVAKATYMPTASTDRNLSFSIPNHVKVYGGFVGNETLHTQRDYTNNPTILSGDIGIMGDSTDNTIHIFNNTNIDSSAVLDGFTVEKGYGSSSAMLNTNATPTLSNCIFQRNTGGAITNDISYPNSNSIMPITNCIFSNNRNASTGGAISNLYNGNSPFSLLLNNCQFNSNNANTGGAIYNRSIAYYNSPINVIINNCTFNLNIANSGGAIATTTNDYYYYWSSYNNINLTLNNVIFTNNQATNGGAIYNQNIATYYGTNKLKSLLTNCTFTNNQASNGGAIYNNGNSSYYANNRSKLTSLNTNCRFSNNTAIENGGAIYNTTSDSLDIDFTKCTFKENTSKNGAAIYADRYTGYTYYPQTVQNTRLPLTFNSCVFDHNEALTNGAGLHTTKQDAKFNHCVWSGNTAVFYGGGIYADNAKQTLANCTFANNTASYGHAVYVLGDSTAMATNCIFGAQRNSFLGSGNLLHPLNKVTTKNCIVQDDNFYFTNNTYGADPLFVNKNDADGADNIWGTADDGLQLAPCSPAINKGNNTGVTATTDFANAPRIQQTTMDIGAYESNTTGVKARATVAAAPYICINTANATVTFTGSGGTKPYTFAYSLAVNNAAAQTFTISTTGTNSSETVPINTSAVTNYTYRLMSVADAAGCKDTLFGTEKKVYITQPRIYVNKNVVGGLNNGTTWADAYTELRDALNGTGACTNEVWVAAGVYTSTIQPDRGKSFALRNNVGIYGGFGAWETNLTDRNILTNPTILSGDIGLPFDASDNSYNIVTSSVGVNNTAILDGFIIRDGNASLQNQAALLPNVVIPNDYAGGGLYCKGTTVSQSSPTIANCTFMSNEGNYASTVINQYASPIFTNCTFMNNGAYSQSLHGTMLNKNANPVLTNCIFNANRGQYSGVIYNFKASPIVTNTVFVANINSNNGYGYYNGVYTYYYGATIYNDSLANPIITNCTFTKNNSSYNIGYNPTAGGRVRNCIFWETNGLYTIYSNNTGSNPLYPQPSIGNSNFQYNQYTYYGIINAGGNITTNPQFLDPADIDGADNRIGTADDGLRLSPCSPAINAGDNAALPASITTDIAGQIRRQQGTVDMGAYENKPLDATLTGTTTVCESGTNPLLTFTAIGGNPPYTFTYTIDGGAAQTIATNTTIATVAAPTNVAGAFVYNLVTVSDASTCVKPITAQTTTITVGASPLSTATLTGSTNACLGNASPVVTFSCSGGTPPYTFTYTLNNGAPQTIATSGIDNTVDIPITTITAGVFNFVLTAVANGNGCSSNVTGQMATMHINPPILFVNKAVVGGLNDGTSWANAYSEVRNALAAAVSGSCTNQIWVAKGTYTSTATTDRSIAFSLKDAIAVYGGFEGYELSIAQRNPANNPTILSGDIGISGNDADNSYHIFKNTNLNSTAFINGFTIEKGNANGTNVADKNGAAFYNDAANPTVQNCTFVGSKAQMNGGAVYNTNAASPSFTNCVFLQNQANTGGAAYNKNAAVIFTNCTIAYNTATAMGGGIADNTNTAAASLVQNSILVNNIASNTATAQWFNQGTVQPISAYNIIQGNLPSNITDEGGNLPNTNPLFLNTNDLDGADNKWGTPDDGIRLSPCSPAINSGIAFRNGVQVNSTLKDLINHSRLRQTVINRGAYEDMDISGYTETVNSTNSSVTADAECSDAAGWTHYVNVKDELLVLSIQKDGNPIGAIGDGTFIVKNATTNAFNTIATQISPSVAPYAPGYWFVANRYWGVTPTTQLHNNGSHVKVRMYYTATDENDLMLRLGHLPLPSDIIFYKMNGHTTNPLAPSNPNPALGHQGVPRALQCGNYGAWLYAYYTASDTVTWTNNSFNGIKYGEFEVKRFSGGGFGIVNGGPVLLPIKLLAFTGRVSGSNNVLDWKTASEQNSSHFIVERSTDGENFEMVGRVLAAGNSATILNYTFTDKAFTALLNYYRLRMTDKDGSYEYSKIIALERKPNKDGGYLQVTPNPANDAITINYQNIADNVRNMKLINELGQVLMDIPIQVDKISTANVATLPAAVYMIQLTTENNVLFIQKVVVTH